MFKKYWDVGFFFIILSEINSEQYFGPRKYKYFADHLTIKIIDLIGNVSLKKRIDIFIFRALDFIQYKR